MSTHALGAKRPEARAHNNKGSRANSRPDLTVEEGLDEVRAAAGCELDQREHHREKHGGHQSKSHARKRTLGDVYVSFQDALLAAG